MLYAVHDTTAAMAKNTPDLNTICPRCKWEGEMKVDIDTKLASNVTVMECTNPELDEDGDFICDHRFAKPQSVKLPESLVVAAADGMFSVNGYSSLGEFVRECVRARVDQIENNNNQMAFGSFLTMLSQDPDTWQKLLEMHDED